MEAVTSNTSLCLWIWSLREGMFEDGELNWWETGINYFESHRKGGNWWNIERQEAKAYGQWENKRLWNSLSAQHKTHTPCIRIEHGSFFHICWFKLPLSKSLINPFTLSQKTKIIQTEHHARSRKKKILRKQNFVFLELRVLLELESTKYLWA